MPYSPASIVIGSRVQEARSLHRACSSAAITSGSRRSIRGLIFITLYGMYEASVTACVRKALELACAHSISHGDLKRGLGVFALRAQFASCREASAGKAWSKKLDLLMTAESGRIASLPSDFPADGSFMRPSQLKLIWTLFDLPGAPWPDPMHIGRIQEMRDARNRIAHGEEAAGERGRLLTNDDMADRISDIEALCLHIVAAFSEGLTARSSFVT